MELLRVSSQHIPTLDSSTCILDLFQDSLEMGQNAVSLTLIIPQHRLQGLAIDFVRILSERIPDNLLDPL